MQLTQSFRSSADATTAWTSLVPCSVQPAACSTTIAGQPYSWATNIVWGDNIVSGDTLFYNLPAWSLHVLWGDNDDNITWGGTLDNTVVRGNDDNVVWGNEDDTIVWGNGLVHTGREGGQ